MLFKEGSISLFSLSHPFHSGLWPFFLFRYFVLEMYFCISIYLVISLPSTLSVQFPSCRTLLPSFKYFLIFYFPYCIWFSLILADWWSPCGPCQIQHSITWHAKGSQHPLMESMEQRENGMRAIPVHEEATEQRFSKGLCSTYLRLCLYTTERSYRKQSLYFKLTLLLAFWLV